MTFHTSIWLHALNFSFLFVANMANDVEDEK
jgi:hypothetical protein